MSFIVVIPARFASTRFPGKPLAMIHGKPMIQHVYERANAAGADKVIVATDDKRIGDVVSAFGGDVCYTAESHQSGTERIAEVLTKEGISENKVIVNVQGDEPFIPEENIRQVANNLVAAKTPMATLCFPISHRAELENKNIVKVVFAKNGKALYFSRAAIPFDRSWLENTQKMQADAYFRHIGIYAYRAGFVHDYLALTASHYESIESLEQLRVLYHGYDIHVAVAAKSPPHGVDTPEDLQRFNVK
ncbi:3-deoxy-manno-octulosonate cytidylyltransferase [Glaciecola petra]|uniref:3-deoxy-manno-octulosonate cytidylyltransferase n=1 Tax=Glaciecola petra TaxID=3075602 RepID=A0ABU2ZPC4_9ALTE|nr:3-deoxy-manno-octulosonate cytidylyltransferase [Aestuariibacter sp. P117]MDT0594483.1 3-deoxy-manno-octulosonate cytidylyltransferase [Aestuariibacter sp. P117]